MEKILEEELEFKPLSDKNVGCAVRGNMVYLAIDATKNFGPSKSSGRTDVVATTGSPRWVDVPGYGRVLIGLNVNCPPK